MKINIETIPHGDQRYPTVGDYWDDENGVMQVRVSDMKDWRYEALVVIHELVEMFLTKHRGIPEHEISEFDIKFEQSRADQLVMRRARRSSARALSQRTFLRDEPGAAFLLRTRYRLVCLRPGCRCARHQEIALSSCGTSRSMLNVTVSLR